jgi:hypothetical protein
MLFEKNKIDFKNTLTSLVALILFIGILREVGLLNLDFYHRQAYYQTNFHYHESSLSAAVDSARLEGIAHQNITQTPIIVLDGNDTLFFRDGYGPNITVTVEDMNTGPLWQPLYKPGYLNAHMHCHYDGGWTKRQGPYITSVDMVLSGDIDVVGTVTIIGPCSYRASSYIMKKTIARAAVNKIQNRLQELEDLYESPASPALAGKKITYLP